jgi:hypothetical protein
MEPDRDPTIHQHTQAGSQKKKRREASQKLNRTRHFAKEEIFTKVQAL